MQKCHVPSFFLTSSTGEENGLELDCMIPSDKILALICSIQFSDYEDNYKDELSQGHCLASMGWYGDETVLVVTHKASQKHSCIIV